jgi:hypothetical protein
MVLPGTVVDNGEDNGNDDGIDDDEVNVSGGSGRFVILSILLLPN